MSRPGAHTVTSSPWAEHRQRADALHARHRHAAQLLTLYLALLDVWEEAWRAARADPPAPQELAGWAVEHALAKVVAATARCGPRGLAAAVSDLQASEAVEPLLAGWLAGAETPPVGEYVARAVLRGPLEAVDGDAACGRDPSPRGGRRCPCCGGRPQLSYHVHAEDSLVTGRRYLACARCGASWLYSGSSCASCGETSGARRTVFTEHRAEPVVVRGLASRDPAAAGPAVFPHLRIEACESCSRYLIDVDMGRDARAVPEVDELTAIPLDLFAQERGLEKIAPNLMGF
jgi:Protein involved in formate dehydrogenase formation